ncbi:MAG: hypothetical protein VZR28_10815, partial [Candidatus Cryptobacteroides sp.]|nr:hypothetical protein [Candidatus Cryptobacteroides sp.]
IHFAIPPNSAFLGLLEEFFFSISNIRKFHHIINQFVKKFSTFPDSPYLIATLVSGIREEKPLVGIPFNLRRRFTSFNPVDGHP